MGHSRIGIRAGSAVLAVVLLGGLGACGSSSKHAASTSSTGATSSGATTLSHLVVCLQRYRWRVGSSQARDAASKALQAQPGFVALLGARGPSGERATIAIFKSNSQAFRAQAAAGRALSGKAHATSPQRGSIAWVNYSGRSDVDQTLGACA
jgi:hypothetical protein